MYVPPLQDRISRFSLYATRVLWNFYFLKRFFMALMPKACGVCFLASPCDRKYYCPDHCEPHSIEPTSSYEEAIHFLGNKKIKSFRTTCT